MRPNPEGGAHQVQHLVVLSGLILKFIAFIWKYENVFTCYESLKVSVSLCES